MYVYIYILKFILARKKVTPLLHNYRRIWSNVGRVCCLFKYQALLLLSLLQKKTIMTLR